MRFSGALLLTLLPAIACAQTAASPQIMTDVKAGDFSSAETLASATGDPLMVKLVTFFRLTDPGGGTPDEIQAFMAANPDWPEQGLLALRAQEASGLVSPHIPEMTPPFLTQAEALHEAGEDQEAAAIWAS